MEKTIKEITAQRYFQILSYLFFIAIFGYFILPFFSFTSDLGKNLPFVSNSAVKVALAWLLCIYIAGDIRLRRGLIAIFILGHLLSICSMLLYICLADVNSTLTFGAQSMSVKKFLWVSILVDAVVTLPAIVFYFVVEGRQNTEDGREATVYSKFLKVLVLLLGVLFAAAAVGYHVGAYISSTKDFFVQLPMVSNSVVKVGFMSMICIYVYHQVNRNVPTLNIVIVAHIISIICQIIYAFWGRGNNIMDLGFGSLSESAILWSAVALDAVITVFIILVYLKYWKQRFNDPVFLRPVEYRALMAFSDVIVEGKSKGEPISPKQIARNIDRYVSKMTARRKWIYRIMLYLMQTLPVIFGKAPFSELDYENRLRYIDNRFRRGNFKKKKFLIFNIGNYLRAAIRVIQQLSFVGYYSDERTHSEVGYEVFSKRERYSDLNIPSPQPHPLKVKLPEHLDQELIETNICIVGSGAAGSILAYELVKNGEDVLLIEKGQYVEPRNFTEDEVEMISKLYGDGIFQQTEDFKFTILQGNCVGGTTVVNNAVCFNPPDAVINQWNRSGGQDAQIDTSKLSASLQHIRTFLKIQTQNGVQLNPGDPLIEKGIEKLKARGEPFEYGIVDANINGCFGCGYCNIGCAYGKKLSMLDTVLPWAQKAAPGKLTIIAECAAEKFSTESGFPKKATTLYARLSDKRQVRIKANKFILSAGTIASSYLLKKSGLASRLPVGKKLCFNVGTPVYGVFDKDIKAYDGLQIAHYYKPLAHDGVIYESWWNPPVSQSINMPGWFHDHYQNMRNYAQTMAIGVLMGSESTGHVVNALTGGPGVEYNPSKNERLKLAKGIKLAGEVLLAAGAEKVMYNTWSYHHYRNPGDLDKIIDLVVNTDELALGTGHPQGGNAISSDPKKGVIGPDFLVHGYNNLYVCDASVFPTSLTVNPQLTVMGLAHYASSFIKN